MASAAREDARDWIERLARLLLDQLLQRYPVVRLPYITTRRRRARQPSKRALAPSEDNALAKAPVRTDAVGKMSLRRGSCHGMRTFALYLRVLELMHDALKVADRIVDDIAASFGTHREVLGVTAAPRALIAGSGVAFVMRNASTIQGDDATETLLPSVDDVAQANVSARKVLVVEKEAVFATLLHAGITRRAGCLMVTGRGYPDVNLRRFLAKLVSEQNNIDVFVLVDFDPHGVHIACVYAQGSAAQAHVPDARVPNIRHLGLTSSHLVSAAALATPAPAPNAAMDRMIYLTSAEARKARRLLDSMRRHPACGLRRALQTMIRMNAKASLEAIGAQALAAIVLNETK